MMSICMVASHVLSIVNATCCSTTIACCQTADYIKFLQQPYALVCSSMATAQELGRPVFDLNKGHLRSWWGLEKGEVSHRNCVGSIIMQLACFIVHMPCYLV